MDKKYRKWHIMALCISAITSVALLINPTLQKSLVDDVIIAQNPDPLLRILFTMLAVKICHEGFRYLMVITLEKTSQNVIYNLRARRFSKASGDFLRGNGVFTL